MYKTAIVQDKSKDNEKDNSLYPNGMSIKEIQDILNRPPKPTKTKLAYDEKKYLLYDAMNNSMYPFLNYWRQFGILNNASIFKIIDKISDNVSMEKIDESQFNNEENEE